MFSSSNVSSDFLILAVFTYFLVAISVGKLGTAKACGGAKALIFSLFFTPVTGIIYTMTSPLKNILKIIHYRCKECGLEYTDHHKYCPSCEKEGKKIRLYRIIMHSY